MPWATTARRLFIAALALGWAVGADARDGPLSGATGPPLFADCRGERTAAPTVVLEAGAFGTSADWDFVLADLAAGGRVCAYDRSGLGRSPPRGDGEDVLARAAQLDGLLDQLGETRPVILVGHSNGALYVQAFADLWPERVAGLAYVNGVGEDDLDHPRVLADLRAERREAKLAVTVGRLGLASVVSETLSRPMGLRGEADVRKRAGLECLRCLALARDEDKLILPGLATVRRLGQTPTRIPTVVIVGDQDPSRPDARAWRAAETAPAKRAQRSWILDMPGATHVSPLTRDRAYLAAAVSWLRTIADPVAASVAR